MGHIDKKKENRTSVCVDWAPAMFSDQFLSQQQLHSRYILQLLLETWKQLRMLPNINRISTCHSKEITICGELQGENCGFTSLRKGLFFVFP